MLGRHQYRWFLFFFLHQIILVLATNEAKDPPPVSKNANADSLMEPVTVVGDGGGYETVTTRIVGGSPSEPGAYPFFAIRDQSFAACGATLIHPDILLSAGHCYRDWIGFDVCIGVTQKDCSDARHVIAVEQEYIHPDFYEDDQNVARNDVMLIKLAESASDSALAGLNVDPAANRTAPGNTVIAIGFGATDFSIDYTSLSKNLQEVEMQVNSDFMCNILYAGMVDEDTMLCAGGIGSDTCQGDSGGPLLSADGYVVGITSWGFGCGSLLGGVYTRVSAFGEWIQNGICSLSSNPPPGCVVPPDWPSESSYAGPRCEVHEPCSAISGWGRPMRMEVNLLGLYSFCTNLCIPDGFIDFLRKPLGLRCGACS